MPRIELRQVTVELEEQPVLRQVSVSFPGGGFTVITGPSGSGKSVLLKTAAGLIPPSGGEVLADGRPLIELDTRELKDMHVRTGFVFQDAALWANLTIRGNLLLPLRIRFPRESRTELERRIQRGVEIFQLEVDLRARPAVLTMGRRKIVSFLRAWLTEPEILLLDEPTASMDPRRASILMGLLGTMCGQGRTLVLVSHHPEMAASLAERLILMDRGRILADGPFGEVISSAEPEAPGSVDS